MLSNPIRAAVLLALTAVFTVAVVTLSGGDITVVFGGWRGVIAMLGLLIIVAILAGGLWWLGMTDFSGNSGLLAGVVALGLIVMVTLSLTDPGQWFLGHLIGVSRSAWLLLGIVVVFDLVVWAGRLSASGKPPRRTGR